MINFSLMTGIKTPGEHQKPIYTVKPAKSMSVHALFLKLMDIATKQLVKQSIRGLLSFYPTLDYK